MSHRSLYRTAILGLLTAFVAAPAAATNYTRTYLVDDLVLPLAKSDYAIDLDGDDAVDNSLGQILGALASSASFAFQPAMDAAVASGSIVHVVRLQSTDANLANDPAAQATWCVGEPLATPPLFDGTESVSCDLASGTFVAALSAGNFTSPSPVTTPNPVSLYLTLAFGSSAFTFGVDNARLRFSKDVGGDLQLGQINGSVEHDLFANNFSAGLAARCNESIANDPSGEGAGCKNVFDTGCAGSPELSGDGFISFCEVFESPLIEALLAPDVQVGGQDANSVGIRFTAVEIDRLFASGFEP
jgi:hypothetical protein